MNKETAMALVRLIVPLLAAIAAVFGWTLDWEIVINVLLIVLTIATFVWSWWKNNNMTQAAQEAQQVLDCIKSGHNLDGNNHIEVTE